MLSNRVPVSQALDPVRPLRGSPQQHPSPGRSGKASSHSHSPDLQGSAASGPSLSAASRLPYSQHSHAKMQSKAPPSRKNQYFLPGEGIRREVITADICRYLGNDALVRPGHHEGREGYLITAYRNLTSDMIADLKADSVRWEAEAAAAAQVDAHAGTLSAMRASIGGDGPDAIAVPYRNSKTHELRQTLGPSAQNPTGMPMSAPQDHLDRRGQAMPSAYEYYQQQLPQHGYGPGPYAAQAGFPPQEYAMPNQDYAYQSGPAHYAAATGQPRTLPAYAQFQGLPPNDGSYLPAQDGMSYAPPPSAPGIPRGGHPSQQPPPREGSYGRGQYNQ
ncbi:MAG: hypothetical protein M1826_003196 [Phylliscum demangeonii]|nr:MAG: hypothetical protein M1826_003196 [Phylliscum demangeonii]